MDIGILRWRHVRQRAERHAEADRGIAGDQENLAAAGAPSLADPAASVGLGVPGLHGKDIAGRGRQAALEDLGDAGALFRVLQLGIGRIDIFRQAAFLDDPFGRVLDRPA